MYAPPIIHAAYATDLSRSHDDDTHAYVLVVELATFQYFTFVYYTAVTACFQYTLNSNIQ